MNVRQARERIACERCGRLREIKNGRPANLCFDCTYTESTPRLTGQELTGGRWVKRPGGIRIWVTEPVCCCGARLVEGTCESCLVWAEKDAGLHAEARESWANRHVIWDILDARKEREEAA